MNRCSSEQLPRAVAAEPCRRPATSASNRGMVPRGPFGLSVVSKDGRGRLLYDTARFGQRPSRRMAREGRRWGRDVSRRLANHVLGLPTLACGQGTAPPSSGQ
eukprot:scaffold20180_cov28-Tisochrysis_lutea.AAC.4